MKKNLQFVALLLATSFVSACAMATLAKEPFETQSTDPYELDLDRRAKADTSYLYAKDRYDGCMQRQTNCGSHTTGGDYYDMEKSFLAARDSLRRNNQQAIKRQAQRDLNQANLEKRNNEIAATEAAAKSANFSSQRSIFFQKAMISSAWWSDWHDLYSEQNLDSVRLSRSETIKQILESDYGVIVPFDQTRFERPKQRQTTGDIESPTDSCETLTPKTLSSVVSALTVSIAPEFTYPEGNREEVISKAKIIYKDSLNNLKAACSKGESAKFLTALDNFLGEYKEVVTWKYTSLMEADKKEAMLLKQKRIDDAKEKVARKEAKKEVARLALIEAEKEKEQQEQERLRRLALEKEQRAREKYESDIKAGLLPVKSLNDAEIYFEPKKGEELLLSPFLKPDGKYYEVRLFLDKQENPSVLRGVLYRNKYCKIMQNGSTKVIGNLRINGGMTFIGRYVGNVDYETIGGEGKTMPAFQAVFIQSGIY